MWIRVGRQGIERRFEGVPLPIPAKLRLDGPGNVSTSSPGTRHLVYALHDRFRK